LPELDHYPKLPGSRDWAALAFHFCLVTGTEWLHLSRLGLRKPAFRQRSSPQPRGAWPYRERGPRTSAPALPARCDGEAVQCAAAAHLSPTSVPTVEARCTSAFRTRPRRPLFT